MSKAKRFWAFFGFVHPTFEEQVRLELDQARRGLLEARAMKERVVASERMLENRVKRLEGELS